MGWKDAPVVGAEPGWKSAPVVSGGDELKQFKSESRAALLENLPLIG